ncbi:MAG: RNA polymerase factor sigma-54, partial [Planctomycetota bacterium]
TPVAALVAYVADGLESNAGLELAEQDAPAPAPPDQPRPAGEDGTGFARLERYSREYDPDGADRAGPRARRGGFDGDADPKMAAMANTAGRPASLHEHLLEQWHLMELPADLRVAGEAIIQKLEPDGYLRVPLREVAGSTRPPASVETLERSLVEVQKLDPPGIGARGVQECLTLQLNTLPGDNGIERILVNDHIDDITHNRLPAIAKATGFTLGEINEAIKAMRSMLHLHPGFLVGDHSVPSIRPDVIVDYADFGGGLEVRLARGNMPNLRVRDDVAALAKSKGNGKDTREFARKHIEEAVAIIDAVNFRKTRLLQVARAIVEHQREFFDVGPTGLRICKMSDLAQELGCDPSTISRTVADKFVQTPRGIYPLRYFFTGGTETEEGETVGWDHVKNRVRELVEAEDKKDPLNDDQVAALLSREGIEISRRTVAKYRQQLDIPAARQRRQF